MARAPPISKSPRRKALKRPAKRKAKVRKKSNRNDDSSKTSAAARTNLTSNDILIDTNHKLGEGAFRECFGGTYQGGTRNQQEAACKRFKLKYSAMEQEFFAQDFKIAEKAIFLAECWNLLCDRNRTILVSKGSVHSNYVDGRLYLVEPLIRDYQKFTSNSGWVGDRTDWAVRCMEAFTHFSYHKTGGQMVVCDIQGRYRHNWRKNSKPISRFELGDPAICSRRRIYGPTDLGEKGIESFFANHKCNEFCQSHWSKPRRPREWFPQTMGTSMASSDLSSALNLHNRATFKLGLNKLLEIAEEGEEEESDNTDGSYARGGDIYHHRRHWDQMMQEQSSSDSDW